MSRLNTDLDGLPTQPGAYLFRDASGEVLYVGKAVDLRARVRQYFQSAGGDGRFHITFLVPQIRDIEVVVTATEREALILEDTLIKKYQPRYNVRLKDDKTWLSVRLTVQEKWPRAMLVRKWRDDGARYFGPYLDEVNARKVLKLMTRTVPLRTCSDGVFRAHSRRPCIEFQMGRCSAPCVGYVTEEDYREHVGEALLLLEGRNRELAKRLNARMLVAAEHLRYEEAARLRDSVQLIGNLKERQSAQVRPGRSDADVFALHREGELACVAIMPVREGRLQDARGFSFHSVAEEDDELLGRLITQLYSRTIPPPPEIIVPFEVADAELRAELLTELAGRKVRFVVPKRGDRVQLVDIALRNAKVRFNAIHSKTERAERAMFGLQKALRLPSLPRRIECYDNSNIQGTDAVGAMVVFKDGKPHKAGYRIFKIKTVQGPDDYATMREVLGRRFKRGLRSDPGWEWPDLVVIDGGRGQLAMVVAACEDLGIEVITAQDAQLMELARRARRERKDDGVPRLRVVAIAKPRDDEPTDKIYEPGRSNPVPIKSHDPALHLLQAARDEAHRFGVSHHRRLRSKRTLRSGLDAVPGIGPTLRKRLLRSFGSLKRLKQADAEAIAAVPGVGVKKAEAILEALAPK
jgi:excinuclease ABC subunit C